MGDWLLRTRAAPARTARTRIGGAFGFRFASGGLVQLHMVLEGTIWLRIDGADRQLGQGDVVLLPRGTPHTLLDDPSTAVIAFDRVAPAPQPTSVQPELTLGDGTPRRTLLCAWFPFDSRAPNPVLDAMPDVVHVTAPHGGGGLRATVGLLAEEIDAPRPGAQPIVDALVDVALVQTIRAAADHDETVCHACWFDGLADPVTAQAMALIHQRPQHGWTVGALADEVGLSRAAFARRFRARVGEPPGTYLTRWRMALAVEQLRTTSDPLDTIARSVGYESGFALSRAVKRELGRSPTQLRAAHAAPATAAAP